GILDPSGSQSFESIADPVVPGMNIESGRSGAFGGVIQFNSRGRRGIDSLCMQDGCRNEENGDEEKFHVRGVLVESVVALSKRQAVIVMLYQRYDLSDLQ
ncbi:hypothetical protein OAF94_00820, partial [bacterium]|nr:hypothetical protein [bacterium]